MRCTNKSSIVFMIVSFVTLFLVSQGVFAADDGGAAGGWGGIAKQVAGSFESIAKLATAGSYLAGIGFSIGAIMKFKQHKDNPTQVPVGTPIALVFIAASLLFLPSILRATGETLFAGDAKTATHEGCVINKSGNCV